MNKALLPFALSLACALGCGSATLFPIPALKATAALSPAPGIRVGTARVDVTPPPGPSTFGHGPDAIATQGYWTRLQCRVFVIEANGARGENGEVRRERYAIVPCDLPAISYSLFREVAHRVEGVVAGDHLLLTATHTHAGPGHYFESGIYSGFLSSRRAGFDTDMLDMLSSRIGRGILDAAKRTVPAELRWVTTRVVGMTRNRSPQSFVMNGTDQIGPGGEHTCSSVAPPAQLLNAADLLTLKQSTACASIGVACREIDPLLSMLEIDELASKRPLGSLTFFAMHPTVLPAHTRLFGGDVFAIASRELEHDMRVAWQARRPDAPDSDPLAGLINTNEGDIVPVWSAGDIEEARNIGVNLAKAAWAAHAGPAAPVTELTTRTAEADMAKATPFLRVNGSRPAELGQGSSHGGSDHATSIDDIVARLPDWESPGDEQAPKAPLLGILDRPLAGAFPKIMPFSLWHIGDRWIAGVPAELTVTSGFRVRSAIATSTGAPVDNVVIAGLANSYMQYVATCEEFQLQHYEGGSTIYGPRTEALISAVEGNLGCQLAHPVPGTCAAAMPPGIEPTPFQAFDVAPDANRTHERYPQPQTTSTQPATLLNLCQLPRKDPTSGPSLCLRWLDSSPGDIPLATRSFSPGPWLGIRAKHQLTALRWDNNDPRSYLNDLGDDFQVRARANCGNGNYGWSAIVDLKQVEWQTMSLLLGAPGQPRFSLFISNPTPPGDRLVADFDQSTPACSRDEILYCTDQNDAAASPPPRACALPNGR